MKISRKFFKWFLPNAEKIITIGVSILILIGLIFLIFIVIYILQAFQKGIGLELLISGLVFIFLIYSLCSDTLISRIFYLFISVLAGVILLSYENKIFSFLFSGLNKKISEEYFITLLLGITTLFTLWIFRTKDIKEQIKNQKKILANQDFFDAMRMLTDDKLVSQEIAVLRLIDISEKNKVYDDTIKLAFIKRMKASYKENELRNYAQYILGWFKKRYIVEGLDLKNLDLSYQDFTATDTELNMLQYGKNLVSNFVIQKMLSADNLDESAISRIDLSEVDLKGTNLKGADLRKVILKKADLRETNLSKVDLRGAILTETNLTGADLTGADLGVVDLEIGLKKLKEKIKEMKGEQKETQKLLVETKSIELKKKFKIIEKELKEVEKNLTKDEKRLQKTQNLTYEQLASVKSLYEAKGLETVLKPEELTRLRAEKPELFEPPKEEQNET